MRARESRALKLGDPRRSERRCAIGPCFAAKKSFLASTVYMTAVRKLGKHISGQLDYELLRTAAGTNRVNIIAAIKTVLTRQDATTSTGQALRVTPGHDPRRTAPAGDDLIP